MLLLACLQQSWSTEQWLDNGMRCVHAFFDVVYTVNGKSTGCDIDRDIDRDLADLARRRRSLIAAAGSHMKKTALPL